MKRYSKSLMVLVIASLAIVGAAGAASARGGCGGYGGGHGGGYGGGYGEAMRNLSPEVRDSLRKAHDAIVPLAVQYRAKHAELSAKIYSGADDKTIQDLTKEVERMHSQLLEARLGLQKQMAKAGLPMRGMMGGDCLGGFGGGMGGCGGMGGGMMGGHGWGHRGGPGGWNGADCYGPTPDQAGAGGASASPATPPAKK